MVNVSNDAPNLSVTKAEAIEMATSVWKDELSPSKNWHISASVQGKQPDKDDLFVLRIGGYPNYTYFMKVK